jgi:predicted DNA-binding transcriptional regulator YafY
MAKSANQKRKLLVLARLLERQTDEEHPVTVQDMINELARWDIAAERKSIYADMEELRQMGYDVQSRKGRGAGWFLGQRDFELAELKLLVDAVQSSRFLTARKSDSLIRKLEGLTSVHQARQLQRQVYVDRRIKTMNESIFYNVDKIHSAIAAGRVITFRYFEYDMEKKKVFRRDGKRYCVSPCGLMWDSENYYLAAWDDANQEVRHYRVDKMSDITVSGAPRYVPEDFDPEGYAQRHFGMFSGRQGRLRLRFRAGLAGVVLDRFGRDVMMAPDGEEHFTVTLDVVVSPPFWGWLFGLGAGVEVLSPDWAAEEFRTRLREVAALYERPQ